MKVWVIFDPSSAAPDTVDGVTGAYATELALQQAHPMGVRFDDYDSNARDSIPMTYAARTVEGFSHEPIVLDLNPVEREQLRFIVRRYASDLLTNSKKEPHPELAVTERIMTAIEACPAWRS